jgi:nucleoside-triphosphatase THEP1
MKLSEAATSSEQPWEPQKILVFGDSKTGKSTLVGKLAEVGFEFDWFDLENGHKVLFKLPKEAQDRINLFKIPDTKTWPIAIETISKVVKGEAGVICRSAWKMGCNVCKAPAQTGDDIRFKGNVWTKENPCY